MGRALFSASATKQRLATALSMQKPPTYIIEAAQAVAKSAPALSASAIQEAASILTNSSENSKRPIKRV